MKKKELELKLEGLEKLERPKEELEQYQTPASVASEMLWLAFTRGDVQGKTLADLGAGNGILGIGALLLGAKCVHFVEIDANACETIKRNLKKLGLEERAQIHMCDVSLFSQPVDVVIMNPPFGFKRRHADLRFLEVAFRVAKKIYSLHSPASLSFLRKFAKKHGFEAEILKEMGFYIKQVFRHHRKRGYRTKVSLILFTKLDSSSNFHSK